MVSKKLTSKKVLSILKVYLKFPYLFIGLFLLISFTGHSQTPNNNQEKVYLHFDKSYYTSGDIIWYKAYIVEGSTNQATTLSKVLYVELIGPSLEIISTRVLKIENGGASGDFQLPMHLETGSYRIRAYTNYMRNFDDCYFFRKEISINNLSVKTSEFKAVQSKSTKKEKKHNKNVTLKPDLQFFPEGGNMVTGFSNRIGFKAIGIDGKGLSVSGVIIDGQGVKQKAFRTIKFGMGVLEFTPEQGEKYTAQIKYKGNTYTYNLPESFDKGVVIQVNNAKDVFKITLNASLPEGIKGLVVIGKQGGDMVCRSELPASGLTAIVNIPKTYLEAGIVQFTVLDKNSIPICERLVFVEAKKDNPKVNIIPSKDTYKKRALIELDMELSSLLESVEQTSISIAVTDIAVVEKEKNGLTIKSHLLLNSELRGNIEQPNYYFESKEPEREQMLDVLMMTQGWRRYLWDDVKKDTLQKKNYDLEKGFTISGTVRKFYNKNKTVPAHVTLMTMNENTINKFEVNTNNQGQFKFGPYTISDSVTAIVKAKRLKATGGTEKKRSHKLANAYAIELDSRVAPEIHEFNKNKNIPEEIELNEVLETENNTNTKESSNLTNKDIRDRYKERSQNKHYNDSILKVEKGTIVLGEVNLKGKKKETIEEKLEEIKKKKRDVLAKNPSHTLSFQELAYIPSNPLEVLQGRIPGVSVKQQPDGTFRVFIRGGQAQIFLNGAPIKDASFINSADIDFIDVIKPPKSYKYGARGHFGIIAIYTKDAETEILLDEEKLKSEKKPGFTKKVKVRYNERSRKKLRHDSILKVEKGTIVLGEVNLKGKKKETIDEKLEEIKEKKRDVLAKNPSLTLNFKELAYIPSNPIEALQGRMPGVRIEQQADLSFKAYTRGYDDRANMKVFLNGVFIEDPSFINSADIDFIDVIKPPKSYKFGANGHFGVIAIYTKDAETEILLDEEKLKNEKKPEFTKFVHPGYYQAKEFYSPTYTASGPTLEQTDFRSTIYWNPNVKLNENGEGKILFYSSDIATSYRVALEGVTASGIPITKEIFIEIND